MTKATELLDTMDMEIVGREAVYKIEDLIKEMKRRIDFIESSKETDTKITYEAIRKVVDEFGFTTGEAIDYLKSQ